MDQHSTYLIKINKFNKEIHAIPAFNFKAFSMHCNLQLEFRNFKQILFLRERNVSNLKQVPVGERQKLWKFDFLSHKSEKPRQLNPLMVQK